MEATNLYFPVRCITCKKVLGRLQLPYEQLIAEGKTPKEAMDALGATRPCCRYNILSPEVLPLGLKNYVAPSGTEPAIKTFQREREALDALQTTTPPVQGVQAVVPQIKEAGQREFRTRPGTRIPGQPRNIIRLTEMGTEPSPMQPQPLPVQPVEPLGPITTIQPLPVQPAQPLPVQPAQPLPIQPLPVQPLPIQPLPVQPLPVQPLPVQPLATATIQPLQPITPTVQPGLQPLLPVGATLQPLQPITATGASAALPTLPTFMPIPRRRLIR